MEKLKRDYTLGSPVHLSNVTMTTLSEIIHGTKTNALLELIFFF